MAALSSETLDRLRQLEPIERVTTAGALIEEYRQAMAVVGQIRSEAVAELRTQGLSLAEIARHLNVTRQQVHRLQQAASV